MSSLYTDAIADARKLREVAEQSAKNRIIDAVTPRLRQLIERELNEGDDELVDDLDTEFVEPMGSELMDDTEIEDMGGFGDEFMDEPMTQAPPPLPMDSDGFSAVEVIDDVEEDEESEESGDKSVHVNITVEARNKLLRHRAVRLVKALSEAKSRRNRNKIRKELAILRQALIITENSQNKRLARNIKVILKESNMSYRRNKWLFEGKDGLGEEPVEFEDAEMEEGGETIEVDAGALEDALGLEPGTISDGAASDEEEDEFDLDMEEEEGEEGEDDLDLELEEYGGIREDDELDEGDECDEDDEIVEVNEAMLRRALRGTRTNTNRRTSQRTNRRSATRVNETRRRRIAAVRRFRRLRENEAKDAADNFGGGKLEKEMFVDVDENTLINALAEELGDAHSVNQNTQSAEGGAAKKAGDFGGGTSKGEAFAESRRRRAARNRRLSESRRNPSSTNRRVRLAERKAADAKKELKESNLFNAKLLYVTKLMQQHTLNQKQQRAIVEAMDNAKTQREAKLLFTSLTESLNKRKAKAAGKTTLTEDRSRTGSSSRSLRSGQAPNNSGVELDRWAVLAGIKK